MPYRRLATTEEDHREAATSAKTDAKKKLSALIRAIRGQNYQTTDRTDKRGLILLAEGNWSPQNNLGENTRNCRISVKNPHPHLRRKGER
jgi:hypothetical protein